MAGNVGQSIPKQCQTWGDVKAAYRFLSNPRIDPAAIGEPHRQLTREACKDHPVVLCVQDTTELDFTAHPRTRGLGKIGKGTTQGMLQHTTLAVTPAGQVLGILDERWHNRVEADGDETRTERQKRWTERDVWGDAAQAIGVGPAGTRFIHVTDREADVWGMLSRCRQSRVGFVIRAKCDRRVEQCTDYLWPYMQKQAVAGTMTVQVGRQCNKHRTVTRRQREAQLTIRYAPVQLEAPQNDPRYKGQSMSVWAVLLTEESAPQGEEAVQWLLLCSEPVHNLDQAREVIGWYTCRWVIEEWHRVIKEGCKLQQSQLDDAKDLQRLSAIVSVIAVRLLQLRDLAQSSVGEEPGGTQLLQSSVPWIWILVASKLSKMTPEQLTPRLFWERIARQGGWLGRKNDRPPGWKVIWRGWYDISLMVAGAELSLPNGQPTKNCG